MYIKTAWRNLIKNKAFAAINILGLTIGITACLIIYADTSFELSYDNFHKGRERIYRVVSAFNMPTGEIQKLSMVPDPMATAIRRGFTGVETVTLFHNYYGKVTVPVKAGNPKRFNAAKKKQQASDIVITDEQYFRIFNYHWLVGNAASMRQPFNVVLSQSKAIKYFGEGPVENIVGRQLIYDDSLQVTVAGIVEDYPANSDLIFTDFISAPTIQNSFLKGDYDVTTWQNWATKSQTFVKLAPGAATTQFGKQALPLIKDFMDQGSFAKVTVALQPLRDVHFNADYLDTYGRTVSLATLYSLMAIAIFILLIAAVNFINLSTAQAFQRVREVGIRKVLGNSKAALIAQLLAETFIAVLFSAALSLVCAPLLFRYWHAIFPAGAAIHFNTATIVFVTLVVVITSLLAGLYPARLLASSPTAISLKGKSFQKSNSNNYIRKGLIVFQFTLSILFFISAVIINNQVNYVFTADMGFKKDAIINIDINEKYPPPAIQALAIKIKSLPGVQLVSVDMGTPVEKSYRGTTIKCPVMSDKGVESQFQTGDENYIPLYGFKLIAGRNLLPSDTMKEYVINETSARKLGFKQPADAIGKRLHAGTTDGSSGYKEFPVVGVVADFHSQSFHETIAPVFISTSASFSKILSVKFSITAGQEQAMHETIEKISAAWKTMFPNENFNFQFFDKTIANYYEKEQHTGQLVSAAMVVAIFIACLGLFGLATFTTHRRIKEIGVRKVLGASVTGIVGMLSADFLKPVLLALIIASPIAYYCMHTWLQGFVYRVPISITTFLLAGFGTLAIGLLTVSYKTIKAAIANPVKSLRSE